MYRDITIEEIEKMNGVNYREDFNKEKMAIPEWYHKIRKKKLFQLAHGDLSRLIRQGIYIEYIVYECIDRLYIDPVCGDKYDGELVKALSNCISQSFWIENESCTRYMRDYLSYFKSNNTIKSNDTLDEVEKKEIQEYFDKLNSYIM